jgi:hypothetical protein
MTLDPHRNEARAYVRPVLRLIRNTAASERIIGALSAHQAGFDEPFPHMLVGYMRVLTDGDRQVSMAGRIHAYTVRDVYLTV